MLSLSLDNGRNAACLTFYLSENALGAGTAVLRHKITLSFLPLFLGQNSSYLPGSGETSQAGDIKDIQYLSFLCLTVECQKVLSPGALDAL